MSKKTINLGWIKKLRTGIINFLNNHPKSVEILVAGNQVHRQSGATLRAEKVKNNSSE